MALKFSRLTRPAIRALDLPTIQKISGHKTLSMVLRYVHIHGTHIDDAISAIDTGNVAAFTPKLHTADRQEEGRAASA